MAVSVYITARDKREARKIVQFLLRKRLIACANTFPVESSYWWKNKIHNKKEYAIIAKTKKSLSKKLEKEVRKIHSYSVPCIVFWPIVSGSKDFLEWVKKETLK